MWEVPTEEQVQNDAHAQSPTGAVGPGEPTVATATVTSNDAVISPPCSPKAPPIPVPIPAVAAVAAAAAAVLPTAHEPIAQLGQPPPPLPPLPLGFSATTPPVQINGPWRRRRGGDEEDGGSSDNGSSGVRRGTRDQ